jgi:hypothetical protein
MILPCYSFSKDLESTRISDFEFKKILKYTMVHPYQQFVEDPKDTKDIP